MFCVEVLTIGKGVLEAAPFRTTAKQTPGALPPASLDLGCV